MTVRSHETGHARDVGRSIALDDDGTEVKVPQDIAFHGAAAVAMENVMRWVRRHEKQTG